MHNLTCHLHLAYQVHILFLVFFCNQDIGSIWLEVSHFTHPKLLDLHRHECMNTWNIANFAVFQQSLFSIKEKHDKCIPLCWMSAHIPAWTRHSPTSTPSPGRRGSPHFPCLCTWKYHRHYPYYLCNQSNNWKNQTFLVATRFSAATSHGLLVFKYLTLLPRMCL